MISGEAIATLGDSKIPRMRISRFLAMAILTDKFSPE